MTGNPVFLIISVIGVIPITVSFYYYYKSKVQMFLVMGLIFFSLVLNQSVRYLLEVGFNAQILYFITILGFHGVSVGYLYISGNLQRIKSQWELSLRLLYSGVVLLLIVIIIQALRKELEVNTQIGVISLGNPVLDGYAQLLSSAIFIYGAYQYTKIDLASKRKKNRRLGILWVSILIIASIPPVIRTVQLIFNLNISSNVRHLFVAYAVIGTSYLSIFRPEIVFLTEDQVFKAITMYELNRDRKKDDTLYGITKLERYIADLKVQRPELFDK